MKKGIIISIVLFFATSLSAQHFAIKNNFLYDATLTPNLGVEFGLGKKTTLDISGGYNPFEFNDDKRFKHWLVQPELRFWPCEKFNGFFWGIHGHGGEFSVAGIKLPFGLFSNLEEHRYEGYLFGGGLTIGYQWVLGKHWNLEAAIGGGYARIHYDKYPCPGCGDKQETDNYNYFGVTKAAISIIYILR